MWGSDNLITVMSVQVLWRNIGRRQVRMMSDRGLDEPVSSGSYVEAHTKWLERHLEVQCNMYFRVIGGRNGIPAVRREFQLAHIYSEQATDNVKRT